MKKYLAILLLCIGNYVQAQDAGLPPRPYKADEMKHWTLICEMMHKAFPATYKAYTVKQMDCSDFLNWAEFNKKREPLTLINKKNEPIGNHPNFWITYSKNTDSADMEEQLIMVKIKDAIKPDNTIDNAMMNRIGTESEKFRQTRTLSVYTIVNAQVDFTKQYYIGTKPEKLSLPVPAFAYLYLFPKGKEVLNEAGEGESGTDAQAFYKDKALIIFSARPPKVTTTKPGGKQSWVEDKIVPQDNAADNILAPVKNIVISITGGEEDVRALIKQIDWKALQSLLGK